MRANLRYSVNSVPRTRIDRHQMTIAAFTVIQNGDNEVLLVHRRDIDCWDLPGGGAVHTETPREAAVREVREECGIDISIDSLTGIYCKQQSSETVFVYRCSVIGGTFTGSDEADDHRYFSMDHLPSSLSPNHAQRVRDANAPSTTLFVRRQSTFRYVSRTTTTRSPWELVTLSTNHHRLRH